MTLTVCICFVGFLSRLVSLKGVMPKNDVLASKKACNHKANKDFDTLSLITTLKGSHVEVLSI